MKELYLTENVRSRDTNEVVDGAEVTGDRANDNALVEEHSKEITSARKKRGRVKIKISRNNLRGKICDIIESSNDLVDKTPSPFASRQTTNDESPRDDTPKRSSPRKAAKIRGIKEITRSEATTKVNSQEGNSGDENDNLVVEKIRQNSEPAVSPSDVDPESESTETPSTGTIDTERAQFNAFQVLMDRKKPLQYKTVPPVTKQEKEAASNAATETKDKLKRNKEKLISLANKKGYAKRKRSEMEEDEEIEARLEKRIKVFKQIGTKKAKVNKITGSSNAVSAGSLHNYFSKVTTEVTDVSVSSTTLKSEVHVPDLSVTTDETEREISKSLSIPDPIRVPENPDLPTMDGKSHSTGTKKRRWSLRINLRSNKHENETESSSEDAENIERGNSDAKLRRGKGKGKDDKEKNNRDVARSSIKRLKKKKISTNVKTSDNVPTGKNDSADDRDRISKETVMISGDEKKELSPEIVLMEEKNPNKVERLAPLFVKRGKPDPAVLEARRAFLQSAPPSNDDRRIDRKVPTDVLPFLPFPTISHVTQLEGERKIDHPKNYEPLFPMKEARPFVTKYNLKDFRCVTNLDAKPMKNCVEDRALTKPNVEEVLKEMESRCPDAWEIWATISSKLKNQERTKQSPMGRGRKKKSVDNKDDSSMKNESNENCTWTEKYRPTSTRDVVGNEEAAEKCYKWLKSWEKNSGKNGESSGDEFYSSDCSYAENNQVAVLLGPHGSGKTASVYAIAEEMGYSVLEINASSKRAGKKILKELEEATKSHRIKRPDFLPLKTTTRDNVKAVPQNSLILVEDVDLIFQEDEGFISAMWQLASNTKRPIVMTGRTACSHLNKMAPQQLRIYYQNAFGSRVSALLELIAFAESGYRLPRPCLDRLLRNGDLRRALLQLQYLLISGKPTVSAVPLGFHQSLWQDMRPCVYKPAIRGAKKSRKKKRATLDKSSSSCQEKSIIDRLAKDLDKLSFLSTMIEIDDPAIEISSMKLEPSLSLDENINDYSSTRETSHEIATWLRNRLMKDVASNDSASNDSHNFRQLCLKKELSVGVDLALSQISPHTLDRRSMTLDYLPSVRTICRAEDARTLKTNKRGNRFFHYLQNLRLPALSTRPNILAAACKMMREDDAEEET